MGRCSVVGSNLCGTFFPEAEKGRRDYGFGNPQWNVSTDQNCLETSQRGQTG
jgi:hypothetical protein